MSDIENQVEEKDIYAELLDPTYPLLQEFRKKCPGTYKHSQMLSSIIENIAIELELNINKMKLVAFYHDIGKMFNPNYFTENQEGQNPHDDIEPEMSFNIITRHVSDSVMILLNIPDFPRDVIEIISRHHGTSLLKFFYKKAGDEPDIEWKYRYKSSRPQSVEDTILMITDCVEATSKSYNQSGKLNDLTSCVDSIIQGLLDDGQLDDVTMKMGNLKIIKRVLVDELKGVFQKRTNYNPDESNE